MIPASRNGAKLSLRALLGDSQFDQFLEQFLYSPVARWAEEGKIDAVTLRRLNKVLGKGGKDVFDVPAEQLAYATRHTIEDGELLRVKLPITSTLAIDNFVKMFSSYEKFKKAVDIQERIFNHVKGTGIESLVVAPIFRNSSRNMVSYPFVNASSLMDRLPEIDDDEKESELLKVIEAYQKLSVELTEHAEIFENEQGESILNPLWTADESYGRFFFGRLGHGDGSGLKLKELISRYMNPEHEGKQYVIHGDLNPGNVIKKNGSYAIIDQEDGGTGFLEFDYCKLLTKAGISDDAEERIVRKAAKNLAKAEGREASAEEVESSEKRYSLNRINQDLFTAVRYLKRARENNKSKTMKGMALVSYNIALRKIDRAVERGFIGADFKEALEAFIAENHSEDLYGLGDKFEEYKERFNPHTRASQENVVSAPSLDLMLAGKPDKDEIKSELAKLRKNLGRRKRNWPKIAALALAGVVAIGSIAALSLYERITQKAQEREVYLESEEMFKDLMLIDFAPE